ncbi:MAG TPA: transaldolase [Actinomycetaceae bacterium]|nr:transaldolase [Actinomycetaceae bacterium]
MTTTDRLAQLSELGVSIWLDDFDRARLTSEGKDGLRYLIDHRHVVGVTTNPAIFAAALSGRSYDSALAELAQRRVAPAAALTELTTSDVRDACDVFAPVAGRTDGVDGRVSIEVDPTLARDTDATLAQVEELWHTIDRPNLHIKIPATVEGLPAIRTSIGRGRSINVTLIFSLDRYRAVALAYIDGLEDALAEGRDLSQIHSVASFFVSRIDSAIDPLLDEIGTPEAAALRGKIALANARLAYAAYEEIFSGERWEALAAQGARPQRLLWASTSTKDPSFRPTLYVEELVTSGVVNTLPAQTLEDAAREATFNGDTVRDRSEESQQLLDELERVGVSYEDVMAQLEDEGIDKFVQAWQELTDSVASQLSGVSGP